jgi:hypothetical protein
MMRDDIRKEVLKRITDEYGFVGKGSWLQKGKCPQCGKRELFTHADNPAVLRCGRANRCGWDGATKDLYPEIFDAWSKRFKATEADPCAAADAYLSHARGLDLRGLRGCYSQESYVDRDRNITSATVRFPLPGGGWWERLIDQPGRFEKKANFAWGKSYRGHLWTAPDHDLETIARADRFWITEGIFDTASHRQIGHVAGSAMSCNNYPEIFLAELRKTMAAIGITAGPELVFAFDVGKAGTEYSRKFVARAREEGWRATAAQPRAEGEHDKLDWNDLLIRDRLEPDHIAEYLWNGEVLLAESAAEKAFLLYDRKKWSSFSFVYDNRTWWAHFNEAKIAETMAADGLTRKAAAKLAADITEIANCAFRILYFQRDEAIDESHYYLRVDTPSDRRPAKAAFSPAALSAGPEFKKRLLGVAPGAQWTGSTQQLDKLISLQTTRIKTVETLDFTGYSIEHGAWVLGDIAVKGGRVVQINDEDYFDFGKMSLKLRSRERILSISYDADRIDTSWIGDIWTAYGPNGLVTLSFWFLSLFAEQVRKAMGSLFFLEMSGEPGSGKTTLIEFAWKLLGRDGYEGFDPQKSTSAGIARNLSKVGNLPIVLIEGDRQDDGKVSHAKRFEWEELKTAFNGRSPRTRGVKSGGNETYEPPMRGAIAIEQNAPVNASPPVLERIVQLIFDKARFGPGGKAAAERLKARRTENLSGFIIHAIRREEKILATFHAKFKEHEKEMIRRGEVGNDRLILNHCQLLAAFEALAEWLKLDQAIYFETIEFIYRTAVLRRSALSADHPVVQRFWELVDYLDASENAATDNPINRHRKWEQYWAISLQHFEERCRNRGLTYPAYDELKKHLPTSRERKFLVQKNVNGVGDKTLHCWVFEKTTPRTAKERT